ncbi:MAG: PAS domain-containing sensor histidine kinase [Actinobacteria bacterium]|nr:PAS domain-containing sensor histidine kinase [Actinomycetota bacterium]
MNPFDDLPDAVLVLDQDRRVEEVNAAACALLGVDRSRLVGSPADEVLDPRGRDGAPVWANGWPAATRLASVHGIPEQTVQVCRGDGSQVRLAVTGRYRRDEQGRLRGVALVLRPVRRRDAEAASGIEVVSTVSHELRSPLTSVKGFTSLMLNRWDRLNDTQKREMIEQVHIDADRVTRLVTELLDISRLETGRLKLRRRMIELPPLIEKVVADVHHLHQGLTPRVVIAESVPEVYADPDKIMQVLTNLVENTGKYADGQGVEVRLSPSSDGSEVRIAVHDEGPGIPGDDLERVFTKFYRSGEGRPTGSGLGLYIARGLVESHGGRMWVESEPGQGCTFVFTLPSGVPEELEVEGPDDRE